jgi:eukaryotic-like serine/threonine-protein kinase
VVLAEPQPLASPVAIGEIVAGKYCVERVLGVGGMGVVVSARHTTLDQIVAIKFLVANRFGSYDEAVARFLAEARAAARIESDYVCRVFDAGTLPSGVPFMVMEHLEGRDLDDEIQLRGQLDLVEAVDYILQAADALAAAHQLGIVHRDIKPANLFLALRPDGTRRVKVLDFGISKSGDDGRRHTPRHLLDKASLGTPAYMSPEQVRAAADVDARADIWGLGAILYELLTGEMAFIGENVKSVLDRVLQDDPCPMSALRPDLPAAIEAIVMRCLDRERDGRWSSAAKFARALAPHGSVGIFATLPSIQRELGSLSSISAVRLGAPHSLEPMIASSRPSIPTIPEWTERDARHSIAEDWTKLQTRRRVARVAVLGLAVGACLVGTAALLMRLAAVRAGDADASLGPAAAANAPPSAEVSLPPAAIVPTSVHAAPSSVQSTSIAVPRASAVPRPGARPAPRASGNHPGDKRD